jgi:two-component system response regulator ResD
LISFFEDDHGMEALLLEKVKILIAEDEERMRRLLVDYLKREGYHIEQAKDGKEAIELFERHSFGLVILDVMMSGHDGWTVCREFRKVSKVPIIMLTAKGEEVDELFGFDLGADEYITKPFSPKILVARIQSLLKRSKENVIFEERVNFQGLVIDEKKRTIEMDGEDLDFSPKEFELLVYFKNNQGMALSRNQILDAVWGYDFFGDHRTIDTHIKKIRLKLKEKGDFIKTVRGIGYRFEVD